MSQLNTRLGRLRARLAPLATSALAMSVIAGGAMLAGGEAKAFTCTFGAGVINGCNYGAQWLGAPGSPIPPGPGPVPVVNPPFYNTWYETNIEHNNQLFYYPTDKDIFFIQGPTAGSGVIDWAWEDANNSGTWLIPPDPHSDDTWSVDVDFAPPLGTPPGQSLFEYVVIIDKGQGGMPHLPINPGNDWFEDVQLTSARFAPPPGGTPAQVTKTVWEAICTSSVPGGMFDSCTKGTLLGTLINSGQLDLTPFKVDKLYIEDLATPNDGQIDNYENIYRQVPGPLPILGAGAAFGFSRRLRSRVKASRLA